jgi:hypothetical protein
VSRRRALNASAAGCRRFQCQLLLANLSFKQRHQIRPDRVMATLVLGGGARLQLHREGNLFHVVTLDVDAGEQGRRRVVANGIDPPTEGPQYLKPGDVVRLGIEKLGEQQQTFVAWEEGR